MLSSFQQALLDDLVEGQWHSVIRNSGLEYPELPAWFYRQQTNAMATIRPMVDKKVIAIRYETRYRLPVVCKKS